MTSTRPVASITCRAFLIPICPIIAIPGVDVIRSCPKPHQSDFLRTHVSMANQSIARSFRFMTSKCPACSNRLLTAFNNGSKRTIANTAYARQQSPAAKPAYTSTAKPAIVRPPVPKPPATLTKPTSTASSPTPATAAAKVPNTARTIPSLTDPGQRRDLSEGLSDSTPEILPNDSHVDWSRSFHGLSSTPFSKEAGKILMQPITPEDVEIKPDGVVYLPEIKYRRILNRAFGPGGWGLAPRGETIVTEKNVTREYGLVVHGR